MNESMNESDDAKAVEIWKTEIPGWAFWHDDKKGVTCGAPVTEDAPLTPDSALVEAPDLLTAVQQAVMRRHRS